MTKPLRRRTLQHVMHFGECRHWVGLAMLTYLSFEYARYAQAAARFAVGGVPIFQIPHALGGDEGRTLLRGTSRLRRVPAPWRFWRERYPVVLLAGSVRLRDVAAKGGLFSSSLVLLEGCCCCWCSSLFHSSWGPPAFWTPLRKTRLLKASLEMLADLLDRSVGSPRGARSREVHKLIGAALKYF